MAIWRTSETHIILPALSDAELATIVLLPLQQRLRAQVGETLPEQPRQHEAQAPQVRPWARCCIVALTVTLCLVRFNAPNAEVCPETAVFASEDCPRTPQAFVVRRRACSSSCSSTNSWAVCTDKSSATRP